MLYLIKVVIVFKYMILICLCIYNLLEELEHGNNSVLSEIPQVISVCTNIPHEISQDSQYVNGKKPNFCF